MKKTTKLLSLLCAITAVIMMIPMQLAVGAEEVVTDPAAGTVYTLADAGLGTKTDLGVFSLFYAVGENSDGSNKDAAIANNRQYLNYIGASKWPGGVDYLVNADDSVRHVNGPIDSYTLFAVNALNPNQLQVISFKAPACGRYTISYAAAKPWGGDDKEVNISIQVAGEFKAEYDYTVTTTHAGATHTVELKTGEEINLVVYGGWAGSNNWAYFSKFQVTLDEVTHTASEVLEENRVEPTCADGSVDKVTRCTKCNALLSKTTEVLPKVADKHKGPELTRNVNVVPATCQTEGSHDVETYCEYCNTVISTEHVVDAKLTDHTPEAGDPVKENEVAATCYAKGSYDLVTKCKTCGGVMATEHKTTDMIEHTPGAPVRENENLPTVVGKAGSYDEVVYCSVPECKAEISRKTVKVYLKKVNYTLKNFGKTTDFSSNNLTLAFTTEGGGTDVVGSLNALVNNPQLLNKLKNVDGAKRYTLGGNDSFMHAELVDSEMRIYAENGGFNAIIFTAPEDGTYTYEFSGHNAWGNDIEVAVNYNGVSSNWGKSVNAAFGRTLTATDTVTLKKGEKILFIPRLTAGADKAGQKDFFVLESFKVSTVKYVESQPVNPGTGTYIAASVFACAVAAVVCTIAAKKKKSI